MDILTQEFWSGFTKRTGLKKTDTIMIGNIDTNETEYTTLLDLFDLFQVPPLPVAFDATDTPTITGYSTTNHLIYSDVYGTHPTIKLFVYDENGDAIEWFTAYVPTLSGGLLDTITYNLGEAKSGYILLKK